jgi:VWFA-related protein
MMLAVVPTRRSIQMRIRASSLLAYLATIGLSCMLLLPTLWAGGGEQQGPPPSPRFATETRLVVVDAVVTDAHGQLVRDLRRDDFEVSENGKSQSISSFMAVDIPIEAPRPVRDDAPRTDLTSNFMAQNARIYVFVLDDMHTRMDHSERVRRMATEFISRLGPGDYAAVLSTTALGGATQEFTRDPRLLADAIAKFQGQRHVMARSRSPFQGRDVTVDPLSSETRDRLTTDAPGQGTGADGKQQALRLLDVIKSVADALRGVRDRRKTIVLFGEGVDFELGEPFEDYPESGGIVQYPVDNVDAGVRLAMQQMVTAALMSHVVVYAVDPRGVTRFGEEGYLGADPDVLAERASLGRESLERICEVTGGRAVVKTDDFGGAVDQIVRETSSYYLLSYTPDASSADRGFRKLLVRVKRPGLTVRARPGYWPDGRREAGQAVPASPRIRESLGAVLPDASLPLSAVFVPVRLPDAGGAVVVAVVSVELTGVPGGQPGDRIRDTVKLAMIAVDSDGKRRASIERVHQFSLRRGSRRGPMRFQLLEEMPVPPGRYQFRVAVESERAAKAGSVFTDVVVPDFNKPTLTASGWFFAYVGPSPLPTATGTSSLSSLPVTPTAARVFGVEERVELLTRLSRGKLSAGPALVEVGITTRAGHQAWTHQEIVRDGRLLRAGGYFDYRVELPLASIGGGRYMVSLKVSEPGTPAETALAMVPIIVVGPEIPSRPTTR